MKLFVPKERDELETRVAASPDTVKRLAGRGVAVVVESGAGEHSRITDQAFEAAGATIGSSSDAGDADVILKVRRPSEEELSGYKRGAVVIATMDPYGHEDAVRAMAEAGILAFSMEFMPRITRAQVDGRPVLPGESCRLSGGDRRGGGVRPRLPDDDDGGRHGAGGARLRHGRRCRRPAGDRDGQAARRRRHRDGRAPGRQGAGGVARRASSSPSRTRSSRQAETAGGYAKEMSTEYQAKQAELVAAHIAKQDIVITTALIPGRPAPRLVTEAMVEVDEAGLDPGRSRGRARRQLSKARWPARSRPSARRQDHRPSQRARPHRRLRVAALRQEPPRLPRDDDRQGQQDAGDRLGRRARRRRRC